MLTVQEQDRQLRDASMLEAALTWLVCGILWLCLLLVQRFGVWGLETSAAPLSVALGICQHSCPLFQAVFGIFSVVGFSRSRSGLSQTWVTGSQLRVARPPLSR